MIDAPSISRVLGLLRPERAALVGLLEGLGAAEWAAPMECPAYTVKGIATHVLGDDLSLLSRQRDRADSGLVALAAELPGVDFRTLLDTFNDRWVAAASFLSTELLAELLGLSGEWTACFYEQVDPAAPGEPVGLFAVPGQESPWWHAIAREYLERWVHHSQIRRALRIGSLAVDPFLAVGVEIVAAAARGEPGVPAEPDDEWSLGPVVLGRAQQAADVLPRAHTADQIRGLVAGPAVAVERVATIAGRPDS